MDINQENAFWETIDIFDKQDALEYVMIIGSWAEYLYQELFSDEYKPNVRTRDVDCFYPNINRPDKRIYIAKEFADRGFIYQEDPLSRVGRFIKDNIIEVSFLSRTIGSQKNGPKKISAFQIYAEGLRDVNILEKYPMHIQSHGYNIVVPEPAIFVIQKLLVYPNREPAYKKEKDLIAIQELMPFIKKDAFHGARLIDIYNSLSDKEKNIVDSVCKDNHIEIIS